MNRIKDYLIEIALLLTLIIFFKIQFKMEIIIIMMVYGLLITVILKRHDNYFLTIRYANKKSYKLNEIKWLIEKSLNCAIILSLVIGISSFIYGALPEYNSLLICILFFAFFLTLGNLFAIYMYDIKKTIIIILIILLLMFTATPVIIVIQILGNNYYWSQGTDLLFSIFIWMILAVISMIINYLCIRGE